MKLVKIIVCLSVVALFVFNTQEPVFARSWFKRLNLIQKEFHPVKLQQKEVKFNIPTEYSFDQPKEYNNSEESEDTAHITARISWREFFSDPYLIS